MVRYADIQPALDLPVFFSNPASPWQRGSNENTNRLLRFWLPKGGDLSGNSAPQTRHDRREAQRPPTTHLGLRTPPTALNELFLDEQHVA